MSRYNIYPSLLDAYTYMRSIEDDGVREVKEQELIDMINRAPRVASEAASRGTALNELIDTLIEHRAPREDMVVQLGCKHDGGDLYTCLLDGFSWTFDGALVDNLREGLSGFIPQVLTEAQMMVGSHEVRLYGYADYVGGNEVVDLKTTSNYSANKYREKWQQYLYSYCLLKSGMLQQGAVYFTYMAVELGKGDILDGTIYEEDYLVTLEDAEAKLRTMLAWDFLPWLESVRDRITDKKIFDL